MTFTHEVADGMHAATVKASQAGFVERPALRAVAAEAIGTFALVFAGCGAIMVDAETGELGQVGIALSFGLVIMVMIYAVGMSRAPTSTRP